MAIFSIFSTQYKICTLTCEYRRDSNASNASNKIKFEIGASPVSSSPVPPSDAMDAAAPSIKRRHTSDDRRTTIRQHWIMSAPRGSLEIRSPARDSLMLQHGGKLSKSQKNASDSKLTRNVELPLVEETSPKATTSNKIFDKEEMLKSVIKDKLEPQHQHHHHHQAQQQGGNLPRTLSTSVLRIKHRRSFWEKVIG